MSDRLSADYVNISVPALPIIGIYIRKGSFSLFGRWDFELLSTL